MAGQATAVLVTLHDLAGDSPARPCQIAGPSRPSSLARNHDDPSALRLDDYAAAGAWAGSTAGDGPGLLSERQPRTVAISETAMPATK